MGTIVVGAASTPAACAATRKTVVWPAVASTEVPMIVGRALASRVPRTVSTASRPPAPTRATAVAMASVIVDGQESAGHTIITTRRLAAICTACPITRSQNTERNVLWARPRWTSPRTPPGSAELRNWER